MILRRLQDSRFSTVAREWAGQTAVVIGGGPSLTLEQVALVREAWMCRRARCIAVNDAYLWAPWADVSYFADAHWWTAHTKGTPKPLLKLSAEQVRERFGAFPGQKCSIESQQKPGITDDEVHILRNARHDPNGLPIHDVGLSLKPGVLITGSNGGWQAIQIAAQAGANPIILLGFDCCAAKDGRTHWSGGHQGAVSGQTEWITYRQSFAAGERPLKAAGIRVINASPGTETNAFEKVPLEEALCLQLTA